MNDLPPNLDDSSGNNDTPPNNRPTNTWTKLCLGLGPAAGAYILCITILNAGLSTTIQRLDILIILAVVFVLNVKLFISQHRIAAIALLIAMTPLYLGALFMGASFLPFMQNR